MIVLNCEQGSEDWLAARCGVITASRFADAQKKVNLLDSRQAAYVDALLAGRSEAEALAEGGYKKSPVAECIKQALAGSPRWAWSADAEKYAATVAVETIARQPLDDSFTTYAMRRGRELEPVARNAYMTRTGAWVEEVSLILTDDERFGYSADGMVDDDGLIEIKCPMAADKIVEVWVHPELAHLEYHDQMQGGMWITGRKWIDLVIYCPWLSAVRKDLFVRRFHRDEQYIETMEANLLDFMKLVDAKLALLRTPMKMSGRRADDPDADPKPLPKQAQDDPAPWLDAAPATQTKATAPDALPAELF